MTPLSPGIVPATSDPFSWVPIVIAALVGVAVIAAAVVARRRGR